MRECKLVNYQVQTCRLADSPPENVTCYACTVVVYYCIPSWICKICKTTYQQEKHKKNITKAPTKHSLIQDNCSGFMYLNTRARRGDRKGNEIDIETNRRETDGEGMKVKEREAYRHMQEEALK